MNPPYVIAPKQVDRVAAKHRLVKARMLREQRRYDNGFPGRAVCTLCRGAPATEAHHTIFTRARITGLGVEPRLLFEHKYNLLLLCYGCHHRAIKSIAAFRWHLIRVQFRMYGERQVRKWVREMEGIAVRVTMPYFVCSTCRMGHGYDGCPYENICDGLNKHQEMFCEECPLEVADCAACIEKGAISHAQKAKALAA